MSSIWKYNRLPPISCHLRVNLLPTNVIPPSLLLWNVISPSLLLWDALIWLYSMMSVCMAFRASLVAQAVKHLPAMRVRFLGREDPLEKEMAIHSSTLAWKIPWMEEPDRLQSMGSQRVGHDWATSLSLSPAKEVCYPTGTGSRYPLQTHWIKIARDWDQENSYTH